MIRGICAVLLGCALTLLVPSAAQAAVTVSLHVSATTVDEGATVTFTGTAAHARLGSTVQLQRKVVDGWRTVAARTLRTSRSFSFVVTPPRGRPVYRVLKPRQLGQVAAVSDPVRLTVRWQPTLTTRAGYLLDGKQRSVTRITIDSEGLGGVTLRERRLDAEPGSGVLSWEWTGRTVTLPGSGTTVVDRVREGRGNLFAYAAPAAGPRKGVTSNAAEVKVVAVPYELSSGPLRLNDLRMGTTAAVRFQGTAGQVVGMAYDDVLPAEADDDLAFRLVGPDGKPVPDGFFGTQPWLQRYGTQTVRLQQTGTYRLDVTRYNSAAPDVASLDVWLSRPKVVEPADPEHRDPSLEELSADWPGQGVLYRFPVGAGEMVVQTDGYRTAGDQTSDACPGHRAFSVAGRAITPWDFGPGVYGEHQWGLLSPDGGTLTALWTPCVTVPLEEGVHTVTHRVDTADLTIGGDAAGLEIPWDYSDRIRFRFTGTAGQRVELYNEYAPKERVCCPTLYTDQGEVVTPDADVYTLPRTGTYHLLFPREDGQGTRTIGVREARGN